jgi:hypothetical protein
VNNHDDGQFESYLQQFRPLAPVSLPVELVSAQRRRLRFTAWTAIAALLLVTAALTLRLALGPARPPHPAQSNAAREPFTNSQPLTIAEANALVARSPSVREAIDYLSFRRWDTQLAKGKQSALAVLSKEKIKL